jgi:hypothetical protein
MADVTRPILKVVLGYRLNVVVSVGSGAAEVAKMTVEIKVGWVAADACTLPTANRPGRLAAFDGLFAALRGLRREEPGWLRLWLDDAEGVAEQARDLTAREAECCSFFDFDVRREAGEVVVDVRVPPNRVAVLDGLAAQAEAAHV